jgi:large subunit ribosomal protein L1
VEEKGSHPMAKQKMKTVDMSVNVEDLKPEAQAAVEEAVALEEGTEVAAPVKKVHVRSNKYHAAKAHVDRTKTYPMLQAAELAIKTSYTKFVGTIIADLVVKDEKVSAEITYPYSTGKVTRVAIVTDELLAAVETGTIEFDVLVSHPSFMPKIARLAKILGPKGLMPNPKNGTVTTDPEKRAKELAGGKTTVKTERKAPLVHAVLGKANQPAKEIAANGEALIKALGAGKVTKMVLSSTMGPGIKVDLTKLAA